MDLRPFFGCAALLLCGLSLFQFNGAGWRKLGMVLIALASALAVYFATGSLPIACLLLLAWFFFPLWEMLFVLRQLRVPRHRLLADSRAPAHEFEELAEITGEMRRAGFQQIDECRLMPAEHEQYYRLFDRPEGRTQGTIGYIAQGAIGFHFIAFASEGKDGRRWVTWDYPLTYGLSMPPHIALYRALHCENLEELYEAHLSFLEVNGVRPDDLVAGESTPAAARSRLEQTLNQQIEYNISRGFLAPVLGAEPENFCYSWRGTLYVAGQILRDLIF